MRSNITWLLVTGITLLSLLGGCSSRGGSDSDEPTVQVHGVSWTAPQANGPTEFHGTAATDQGASSCAPCHGADLQGYKDAPGCTECHFDPAGARVPTGVSWDHGNTSHAALLAEGETCNGCHASLRAVGQGPDNCHDCHVVDNHPLGQAWLDPGRPDFHGTQAEEDLASCRQCHGSDLKGGVVGVSCDECHFGPDGSKSPVGKGWNHGSVPHAFSHDGQTCTACHDLLRSYQSGPEPCHDCHLTESHPLGQAWLDRDSSQFHGLQADADLAACASCHGSNYQGGTAGVSCNTCHFGPGGSKSPAGSGWQHGSAPHASLADSVATCTTCHELSRLYGNGPESCHDCHAEAAHPTGQAWLDVDGNNFHGDAAATDLAGCASCHGADYRGGSSGVGCYGCHFGPSGSKRPAGSNWQHGTTPHGNLSGSSDVCTTCHEVSRLYGNGPESCHDCHLDNTHPLGEAWLDVKRSGSHEKVAATGTEACASCHGADFQGGSSGTSCSECHFGPSGGKSPPGTGWQHGTAPHTSLAPYESTCSACHQVSRQYGNGPAACHDCHAQQTHPTGRNWLDKGISGYHGDAATTAIDSCKTCHGSNLTGGTAGVSCYSCHFGPGGGKVPSGSSWAHGSTPHTGLTANMAICNSCHAIDRSYSHGPEACHDCHLSATHPTGRNWLSKGVNGFHGDAAQQDIDSCRQCHGQDYRGGSSGVGCYTCHFGPTGSKVPGGVSWSHGSTPHAALEPYIDTCNACHAIDRNYGFPPASCHDCHAVESHPLGEPWLKKTVNGYHGDAADQNLAACASCHGADYRGGSSGVSCYQCHFGPSGSRSPSGSGWNHATGSHSSLQSQEAVCTACHTINRSYGLAPESCHDCHDNGPSHATGATWLLPQNHAQQSISNRSACLGCHAMSGSGGSSPSCRSCHTAADPPLSIGNCVSCHAKPPNTGKHTKHISEGATCVNCHDGFGSASLGHWYPNPSAPADIRFRFSNSGDNMTATFDSQGNLQRCLNTCHVGNEGENHGTNGRSW